VSKHAGAMENNNVGAQTLSYKHESDAGILCCTMQVEQDFSNIFPTKWESFFWQLPLSSPSEGTIRKSILQPAAEYSAHFTAKKSIHHIMGKMHLTSWYLHNHHYLIMEHSNDNEITSTMIAPHQFKKWWVQWLHPMPLMLCLHTDWSFLFCTC